MMGSANSSQKRHLHVEEDSYFVPMADMLAGILFIVLILLMSFAVIHYPADQSPLGAQQEQIQILDRKPSPEFLHLKRIAELVEARNSLLRDVAERLGKEGIETELDLDNARLVLNGRQFFDSGKSDIPQGKLPAVQTVGRTLAERFACRQKTERCGDAADLAAYVFVNVLTTDKDLRDFQGGSIRAFASGRMLNFFTAMAQSTPFLLDLQNGDKQSLIVANSRIVPSRGNATTEDLGKIEIGINIPIPEPLEGTAPIGSLLSPR